MKARHEFREEAENLFGTLTHRQKQDYLLETDQEDWSSTDGRERGTEWQHPWIEAKTDELYYNHLRDEAALRLFTNDLFTDSPRVALDLSESLITELKKER